MSLYDYQKQIKWHYTCSCGYSWITWWNRYSQDECRGCGLYNYPIGEDRNDERRNFKRSRSPDQRGPRQ